MKTLCIVTGCLNEAGNIETFFSRVFNVGLQFPQYNFEVLIADNGSTDGTRDILRRLASQDHRIKVFFNSKNFGPVCSGYNVFMQAKGDAVVLMACDLQDPPELISDFIKKWEQGNKIVVAVKASSQESSFAFFGRTVFYRLLGFLSDTDHVIQNFTGFGLYDQVFLKALRRYNDPVPYLRGFVTEIGFSRAEVPFVQPKRTRGKSKHSFISLYDVAMGGIINHSKLPLRLATFAGFFLAFVSLLIALLYLIYKFLYWDTFSLGLAPLVIGVFFFSAVQLIFIGIIGEYIGAILAQVKNRPWAIIEETINCPNPDA